MFGDFELTGIELVRKGTSSNECKHYEVNFRKKYGLDKGKLFTVNLTESAPDFSNRYLTANQLMTNLEQLAENSDTPQDVMLSAHGLTRAPALAVAQQIQEFIKRNPDASHGQVNTQLQRMIEEVKEGRGVKCLSKTEQTDALYELAAKLFRERQAAS